MKVIQSGYNFRVYDDGLIVHEQLPPDFYTIDFDPRSGPSIRKIQEMKIKEKVYGIHTKKIEKTLAAFTEFERNLGVILSGDKGIGKSLFAKCLAIEAVKAGLPLIKVDGPFPGIADFIAGIQQEVVVLFDEFDKSFHQQEDQNALLTLFDGLAQGKKMFIITCNETYRLSEFLFNRPGRFHYKFDFPYPGPSEITEYLKDKVSANYHSQIKEVVNFARKTPLNYDCLRAIAFELNSGLPFKEAILDLNIARQGEEKFNLTVHFKDGEVAYAKGVHFDLFEDEDTEYIYFKDMNRVTIGTVEFLPSAAHFDMQLGKIIVPGADCQYIPDSGMIRLSKMSAEKAIEHCQNYEWHPDRITSAKKYVNAQVDYLEITRVIDRGYRFR